MFSRRKEEGPSASRAGSGGSYRKSNGSAVDILSSTFDGLHPLDTEDLKSILNDDEKLDEFIADHPFHRGIRQKRDELDLENRLYAQETFSREAKLRQAQDKLRRSHDELAEKRQEVDRLQRDGRNPSAAMEAKLAAVQTSAADITEECEALGKQFTTGAIPLDSFLEDFLRKSSEAYVRQIKADKFQHYVEAELSSQPTSSPSRPRNNNHF